MRWSSVILGAMALAVAEAVLSSPAATARTGGFLAGIGGFVRAFVSPAVPAFKTSTKTTAQTTQQTSPLPSATVAPVQVSAGMPPALD
jgi:hypothetical protein